MTPRSRPDFDVDRAVKCARVYASATGVGSFVIDTEGTLVFTSDSGGEACDFCASYHRLWGKPDACIHAHLYGSYQAERFGGRYIYFCPIGFVHWASPITADGMMRGAILGGPVLLVDPDEFFRDDIQRKHSLSTEEKTILRRRLSDVPFLKPERVTDLSELLFVVSTYISRTGADEYDRGMEQLEQQSTISEYIHYIKTMGGDDADSYPIDKERELIRVISLGDKAGAQKLLNEILGYVFFSAGGKLEVVKARVLELVVLLSRAAMEGGADAEQIFGLNFNYINQIHRFKTIEDLSWWLSRILNRFTDLVFDLRDVKHVDVFYKAIDFIKKNYMRKIGLNEVAEHVRLSPSYFSKLFKDEMNCNFNAFVNQVRVDRSKTVLMDENVPLVDVAFLTGFEDQSYFTKVFKRHTGLSPGRYRETRGQFRRLDPATHRRRHGER